MNTILQYETEKENNFCFDFLEEKIREGSRKLIESIYEEEVQLFLDRITDEKIVGTTANIKNSAVVLFVKESQGVSLQLQQSHQLYL